MSVYSRLSEVCDAALEIPFDNKSKIILFSDCHRSDNSWADEFATNQSLYFFAMKKYYEEGFTYIELGDGDELYEIKRFETIHYAHSHIFWLLHQFYEEHRFHMIHGNHDMERADPDIVKKTLWRKYLDESTGQEIPLFDGIQVHEGLKLRHTPTGGTFFLFHGYQGDVWNDNLWKFTRFMSRSFWRPLQLFGINSPTSPAKNFKKRDALEIKVQEWIAGRNQPVIFGHTHRPSFPENAGDAPYFNTGSCVHPRCITGIEIVSGKIQLIKWWFSPDDQGRLTVTRKPLVIAKPVKSFFPTPAP